MKKVDICRVCRHPAHESVCPVVRGAYACGCAGVYSGGSRLGKKRKRARP